MLYKRRLLTLLSTRMGICRTGLTCLLVLLLLMAFSGAVLAAGSIMLNVPDSAVPGGVVRVTGSINDNGPAPGAPLGITVKNPNDAPRR